MHEKKKLFHTLSFQPPYITLEMKTCVVCMCVVDAHYNLILISYLLYWHSNDDKSFFSVQLKLRALNVRGKLKNVS